MHDFLHLKKNLKKDFSNLKSKKIALLGDTSTQFLVQAIRGLGYEHGYNLNIWESDFNQIESQIFDPSSELYEFNPEVVVLFQSSHRLLQKYNKSAIESHSVFAINELDSIENIFSALTDNINSKIIFYNYAEIDDSIFGNYSTQIESSFLFQLRKLNYELMNSASIKGNFYLCDLSSVQNQVGKVNFFQPSIYINSEMVLSLEVLPLIASKTIDLINAFNGKFKKCIILDLDNTTWGGIIGDDGIENIQLGNLGIGKAFTEFQYWIKKLKNRGIIIAVCSKNTESVAKEVFEKHPDMVLRLEDISVFIANWENKVDNIKQIQKILNIDFESMVFLDDNPFERNFVRENIPQICIPELPEDPADYLEYLYTLNLFETITFSNEDKERTKLYQDEARRTKIQKSFTNENDFLISLGMYSKVESFNKFNIPRVAQLSQRSNQFNLRTIRYTETELEKLCLDNKYFTFSFTLEDKYGDNGLICVVILKTKDKETLFIDSWFMSCRVLKRGMENFVLNTLVEHTKNEGFTFLEGEYLPSIKNEMVKDHYKNLGFEKKHENWILSISAFKERVNHITTKI
jgi:FkbH-like protein